MKRLCTALGFAALIFGLPVLSHAKHDEDHEQGRDKGGRWPLSQALQSRGVKEKPHRFSRHDQILNTEPRRSVISYPHQGMNGRALGQHQVSSRHFNDELVRRHMGFVAKGPDGFSSAQLSVQLRSEHEEGRYYWHHRDGFDYVHYNDAWGYPWFGWYVGDSYFWTRYYGDRWWVYDDGQARWSYWSGNNWYWQDPSNMSALYIYSDGAYISVD